MSRVLAIALLSCVGCAATPRISVVRSGDVTDELRSAAALVTLEEVPRASELRERALLVADHHPTLEAGLDAVEAEARALGCDTLVRHNVRWLGSRLSIDAVCGVRTATLAPPRIDGVRVTVRAGGAPGRLYLERPREDSLAGPQYSRPLCTGACELTVAPGVYRFGRAEADGAPLFAEPITVREDMQVGLRYANNSSTRWLGLSLLAGSPLVAAAIAMPTVALAGDDGVVPAAVAGGIGALGSLVVGYVLLQIRDEVSIDP